MYKRIIARLDIKNNYLVKGISYEGLRVLGIPEKFSSKYYENQIDEIHYQDVVASLYERNKIDNVIEKVVKNIFVTFSVGGGLRTTDDIKRVLSLGADKVSLNTAAVKNPNLIKESADIFGSSTITINIDTIKTGKKYLILTESGREKTNLDLFKWIETVQKLGAGEICISSISNEGKRNGYDVELYNLVKKEIDIPLIAHGGCGSKEDILEVIEHVDAVSIASFLHYSYLPDNKNANNKRNIIKEIKDYLKNQKINVR